MILGSSKRFVTFLSYGPQFIIGTMAKRIVPTLSPEDEAVFCPIQLYMLSDLTQERFAYLFGTSPRNFCHWLRGSNIPLPSQRLAAEIFRRWKVEGRIVTDKDTLRA